MDARYKMRGALALCTASSIAALCVCALVATLYQSAHPLPDPAGTLPRYETVEGFAFPSVNWTALKAENDDVIAWISIPGTKVNFPIVQAPRDNPTYYLTHDVHGAYNPLGCPYLDANCAEAGLDSPNAVIFGHHWYEDEMFGTFTRYTDTSWATEHQVILLQTPTSKRAVRVQMASIVNGDTAEKRIAFASKADYRAWFEEQRAHATTVLHTDRVPEHVYTIVTCSYTTFANERTVTVAADGQ